MIFKVLTYLKRITLYAFFIFSTHLTAATGLVGGLAVFVTILDPNYGTFEANQIIANLATAVPVILQFVWMLNVFLKNIKTIIKATIVSLFDFIIGIILMAPLMIFFS